MAQRDSTNNINNALNKGLENYIFFQRSYDRICLTQIYFCIGKIFSLSKNRPLNSCSRIVNSQRYNLW